MSEEVKSRKGTAIEPAEAEKLGKEKMGTGRPTPPMAEVEAQGWRYWELVWCPYCWAGNWCYLDTHIYLWFTCWRCGGPFKA